MVFKDLAKMFQRQGASLEPPEDSQFKHKPVSPAKAHSNIAELSRAHRFERVQQGLQQETQKLREAEAQKIETAHKLEALKQAALEVTATGQILPQEAGKTPSGWKLQTPRKLGRPPNKSPEKLSIQKSNRRLPGAPILRRDPTAAQKVFMATPIDKELKMAGHETPKDLSSSFKQKWEVSQGLPIVLTG